MSARQHHSASAFKSDVEALFATITIPETEQSWDTIAKGVTKLTNLCRESASNYPAEFVSSVKKISTSLISSMTSERTRLSGAAIDLVSVSATTLGASFEPLIPVFFPTLLLLCSRSNKVFVGRARACIFTIIESTQLPSILPLLLTSLKDKSASLRLVAVDATLKCMNCFNPPDLEKETRAKDIEGIIRTAVRDANADIRKASRSVFEAYKVLTPDRVNTFTAPLSPTSKKYLNVKNPSTGDSRPPSRAVSVKDGASSRPNSRPNLQFSNSTSNVPSNAQSTSTRLAPPLHVRSASSSAIPDIPANRLASKPSRAKLTAQSSMPPPDYVPVRPPQRPQQPSSQAARHDPPSRPAESGLLRTESQPSLKRLNSSHSAASKPALQAPTLAQASTSSTHANSRSAADARGPVVLTRGADQPSNGPRRVPVAPPVEEAAAPPTMRSGKTAQTAGAQTKPPVKPNAPVPKKPTQDAAKLILKPTLKPSGSSVPSKEKDATTSSRAAGPATARGASQPTLSQLSRAKLVADEKKAGAKAAAKPLWGRLQPRKAGPLKPAAGKSDRGKAESGPAEIPAAAIPLPSSPTAEAIPLPSSPTAEAIPLPPSPTPGENVGTPVVVQIESSESSPVPAEKAGVENKTEDDAASTAALPEPLADSPSNTGKQPEIITSDATPEPELISSNKLLPTPPKTPHALGGKSNAVLPQATPITALLSSIEHGFLFTPGSPLSPPHSYLVNTQDTTPSHSNFVSRFGVVTGAFETKETASGSEFGTKKATEDRDRMVLEEVVNI